MDDKDRLPQAFEHVATAENAVYGTDVRNARALTHRTNFLRLRRLAE